MDVSHHREPGTASAPFFPLMFYILNKTLETLFVPLASCAILGDDNKNSWGTESCIFNWAFNKSAWYIVCLCICVIPF